MTSNRDCLLRDPIIISSSVESAMSIRTCTTSPAFGMKYQNLSETPHNPLLSNPKSLIYSCPTSGPPKEVAPFSRPVNEPPIVARNPLLPFRPPVNEPTNDILPRLVELPFIQRQAKKQPLPNQMSMRHSQCFLRRRTLILLNIFSFMINIAAVAFLCAMLIDQIEDTDSAFPETSYEACLNCISLKWRPGDTSTDHLFKYLHSDERKGKQICCGRSSRGLSALLQLMNRGLQNTTTDVIQSTDNFTLSPVSAHVTFKEIPADNKVVDLNKTYILKFNKISAEDENSKTHVRQVTLTEDSVRIVHTGRYFVYSSAYFRPANEKPCGDFQYQTWGNYIVRISPQSPANSGALVKTAHTCCDHCSNDHHSTFTGGVFNFLSGDQIHVESSGGGIIRFENTASFFGLFLLGTDRQDDKM